MAQHERLVHWLVHRQGWDGLTYAEAVQAARVGLWHALQGYDPTRGTRFSSYAVPVIRHAVWRACAASCTNTPHRAAYLSRSDGRDGSHVPGSTPRCSPSSSTVARLG